MRNRLSIYNSNYNWPHHKIALFTSKEITDVMCPKLHNFIKREGGWVLVLHETPHTAFSCCKFMGTVQADVNIIALVILCNDNNTRNLSH